MMQMFLAAIGASAALTISDIPFDGPIAEVRVGRINGQLIVNPTHAEIEQSDLELIVAGTSDSITYGRRRIKRSKRR